MSYLGCSRHKIQPLVVQRRHDQEEVTRLLPWCQRQHPPMPHRDAVQLEQVNLLASAAELESEPPWNSLGAPELRETRRIGRTADSEVSRYADSCYIGSTFG